MKLIQEKPNLPHLMQQTIQHSKIKDKMGAVSQYWKNNGKTEADVREGKVYSTESTYLNSQGIYYMCDECCNGDRCDDPTHRRRESCHACLGTGINLTAKNLNDEKLTPSLQAGDKMK